jgi:hypothetical protein
MHEIISTPAQFHLFTEKEWTTIFIAIAWNVWLAQNCKVFDNANTSSRYLEGNCWSSLALWAHCSKQPDHQKDIQNWAGPENRIV